MSIAALAVIENLEGIDSGAGDITMCMPCTVASEFSIKIMRRSKPFIWKLRADGSTGLDDIRPRQKPARFEC